MVVHSSGQSAFSPPLTRPFAVRLAADSAWLTGFSSHEIAYIFGQLCSPYSIPSLVSRLRDPHEDDMVRHEAAEALGGIASDGAKDEDIEAELPDGGVLNVLREWAGRVDAPIVVRESCQVAIDMWEVRRLLYPWAPGTESSCAGYAGR